MATTKRKSIQALCSNVLAPKPRTCDVFNRSLTSTAKAANQPQPQPHHNSPIPTAIPHFRGNFQPIHHPYRPHNQNKTSFDSLIHSITTILTAPPSSSPTLPQLHALLETYTSDPSHWSRYAQINPSKQYTRNLVHEVPGLFNLLLLVWTPGKASPVHDHADSHCLMKVLQGELRERRYAIPRNPGLEGPLMQTGELRFGLDKVGYISDELGLHEISNPSQKEYAVSLHLYTPPNAAMRGCHVYDMESGGSKHVMQGAYDSIRGVIPT